MIVPQPLDLVIVGGGPIGLACGLAAKRAGLTYLIVEKGCLVNSLYNYPLDMTFFSTAEKLEIGNIPFVSTSAKPGRAEAMEYYRRVAQVEHLNIKLFEQVNTVAKEADSFNVSTARGAYQARNVVIATGFYDYPNLLGVPGEALPKVHHYYREAHSYSGQHVLVVGANNSAADAALQTWRKGAVVTLAIRESALGRIKYWTKPDLENRIDEGSIRAYFNSHISAIREAEVDLHTPDGLITLPNDFVLAMTGYRPDFALLERMGISLSDDDKRHPSHDPETMETNVPGLYLAGVVCGGMDTHVWFIENSRIHADKIIRHIQLRST